MHFCVTLYPVFTNKYVQGNHLPWEDRITVKTQKVKVT